MDQGRNESKTQPERARGRQVSTKFAFVAIVVFIAALVAVVIVASGSAPSAQGSTGDPGPGSLGRPDRLPRVVAVLPDEASGHPWSGESVAVVYKDADARVVPAECALYVDGAKAANGGKLTSTTDGKLLTFVVGDAPAPGAHTFEVVLTTTAGTQARTGWDYMVD